VEDRTGSGWDTTEKGPWIGLSIVDDLSQQVCQDMPQANTDNEPVREFDRYGTASRNDLSQVVPEASQNVENEKRRLMTERGKLWVRGKTERGCR
jgi:hypothetical protein